MEQTASKLGPIDILVNNAGPFFRERRFFADYNVDEIDYLMRGNLLGVMELDHLGAAHDEKAIVGGVSFILDSGKRLKLGAGRIALLYAAAKVGLVSFTKTLAEEEAAHGITVNMICPGDIRGKNKERTMEEARLEADGETPVGRPGTGEDVAQSH